MGPPAGSGVTAFEGCTLHVACVTVHRTYRGRAGVIEIDGPPRKGRRSDDASRERLLRSAGVKYIDRLDVQNTNTAEVQKFITDFLKHLGE